MDSLALALLALDPLPLGEVEPKRGRGTSAIYIRAVRLTPKCETAGDGSR